MNFFIVECETLERDLSNINLEFINDLSLYTEMLYDKEFLESKHQDHEFIITKINKFFTRIIISMENFTHQIKLDVDRKVREFQLDAKLRDRYSNLKEKKDSGIEQVIVMDCWTLRDDYLTCVNELNKYGKRISKMQYTNVEKLESDISSFKNIIDKYDSKLQEDCDKEITVSVDKMLKFVEDEITGRSHILESLNDGITTFKQMNHDCKVLEMKKDILGPDILTKRISVIRRVTIGISNFIRKWTAKIISSIIIIVG